MDQETSIAAVRDIMIAFAERTGLVPGAAPVRYLWTDAFAVCNFLGLYRQSGDEKFLRLALDLIDQVHRILGRHRDDDSRTGWLSGLDDAEAAKHPTAGGLRIGKKLNERGPTEPWDERLEWDRDGQYFHYLTKWMHALSQTGAVTGDPVYNRWAVELAKVAYAKFTYVPSVGATPRMYWKMSIDLSRPLVPAMGDRDALDAVIVFSELTMRAREHGGGTPSPDLGGDIAGAAKICRNMRWDTEDPLGIGGLLCDVSTALQLTRAGAFGDPKLLEALLMSSGRGLVQFMSGDALRARAAYRLAFRELGLSIGLHAVARMQDGLADSPAQITNADRLRRILEELMKFMPVAAHIEDFWRKPENQQTEGWTAHRDINDVMLAASLMPDAFLSLSP